jgi:hypothetical protein
MTETDEKERTMTVTETENTDDKLNNVETALRDTWAMLVAERAGTIARAHGWPQPDDAQLREMTGVIVRALTELVRRMRRPDALPPSREELNEVLEGFALGVLEKVMGPPTQEVVH